MQASEFGTFKEAEFAKSVTVKREDLNDLADWLKMDGLSWTKVNELGDYATVWFSDPEAYNQASDWKDENDVPDIRNGDQVRLKPRYADRNPNEVFTVSRCNYDRRKCWIGDDDGRGWNVRFDQIEKVHDERDYDESIQEHAFYVTPSGEHKQMVDKFDQHRIENILRQMKKAGKSREERMHALQQHKFFKSLETDESIDEARGQPRYYIIKMGQGWKSRMMKAIDTLDVEPIKAGYSDGSTSWAVFVEASSKMDERALDKAMRAALGGYEHWLEVQEVPYEQAQDMLESAGQVDEVDLVNLMTRAKNRVSRAKERLQKPEAPTDIIQQYAQKAAEAHEAGHAGNDEESESIYQIVLQLHDVILKKYGKAGLKKAHEAANIAIYGQAHEPGAVATEGNEEMDEGKWDYPKNLTSKTNKGDDDYLGGAISGRKKEDRKEWRKKQKAKAHKELMKGKPKTEDTVKEGKWKINPVEYLNHPHRAVRYFAKMAMKELKLAKKDMQQNGTVSRVAHIGYQHAMENLRDYIREYNKEKHGFESKMNEADHDWKSLRDNLLRTIGQKEWDHHINSDDDSTSYGAVRNSIAHRIAYQQPELIEKFGMEKVADAIIETASFYGHDKLEEIGGSDVSAFVQSVIRSLTGGVSESGMTRKQKDLAVMRHFAHDPETGQAILARGKKDREENKAFASAKREINRQKKKEQGVKESDAIDTVTVDVPLLIRLLEYAREDAKTDMDLHDLAEKLIAKAKGADRLTMDDYDSLVPEKAPEQQQPMQDDVDPNPAFRSKRAEGFTHIAHTKKPHGGEPGVSISVTADNDADALAKAREKAKRIGVRVVRIQRYAQENVDEAAPVKRASWPKALKVVNSYALAALKKYVKDKSFFKEVQYMMNASDTFHPTDNEGEFLESLEEGDLFKTAEQEFPIIVNEVVENVLNYYSNRMNFHPGKNMPFAGKQLPDDTIYDVETLVDRNRKRIMAELKRTFV